MSVIEICFYLYVLLSTVLGAVRGAFRNPKKSPIKGLAWIGALILSSYLTRNLIISSFFTSIFSGSSNLAVVLIVYSIIFIILWIIFGIVFSLIYKLIAKPIKNYMEQKNEGFVADRVVGGVAGAGYGFLSGCFIYILVLFIAALIPNFGNLVVSDLLNASVVFARISISALWIYLDFILVLSIAGVGLAVTIA